jgi:ABC-type cobalamin/Fe3+-siderophores transport system ATPase subunit
VTDILAETSGNGTGIGRDEIIAALRVQLAQRRLLTIVGPGGIGKTTVACRSRQHLSGDTAFRSVNAAPVNRASRGNG